MVDGTGEIDGIGGIEGIDGVGGFDGLVESLLVVGSAALAEMGDLYGRRIENAVADHIAFAVETIGE